MRHLTLLRTAPTAAQAYSNALEPDGLIQAFIDNPPDGFTTHDLSGASGSIPTFETAYNILTTLDDEENKLTRTLRSSPLMARLATLRTLFLGTTVSEYALYPSDTPIRDLVSKFIELGQQQCAQLLIVKDIPAESPLLTLSANESASGLLEECRRRGFAILSGQALAYVPIDFRTLDEYLATKLSYSRRKEFRRKLRSRSALNIEVLQTGDPRFTDEEGLCETLYALYENVYAQSKYHFDKLSLCFLRQILVDASAKGTLFLYRRADNNKIVGWNLCYVHRSILVDKYLGFAYPDARDFNLYFVSWFRNLEYALEHGLSHYIAGWTDPEVKTSLGASFTFTQHAVYVRNWFLRWVLNRLQRFFEPDANWAERAKRDNRAVSLVSEGAPIPAPTSVSILDTNVY